MSRLLLGGLLICLAADGGSATQTPAPSPQAPIVLLDVGVESTNGTPVTKLTAADFELRVDSVPRPISSFSTEHRPLVLAMLVDVSTSMGTLPLAEDDRYRRMFESAIRELQTGDRAALGRVSIKPSLTSGISGDPTALLTQVSEVLMVPDVERFGPSPLWDSLISAIDLIAAEPGSRAVIVWTDGRSTGNRFGMADASDRAGAGGVSVHVLVEHFPAMTSRLKSSQDPCAAVVSIVTATGGSCLVNRQNSPETGPPIRQARRVVNALHHRYVIGFQRDAKDGQGQALDIRVKQPGLIVRAARQYRPGH